MKYKIVHATTYGYESPVRVCNNLIMLKPRDSDRVHCGPHKLRIHPTPAVFHERRDVFGNFLHAFSIEESHRQLKVIASSRVTVKARSAQLIAEHAVTWNQVVQALIEQTDPKWLEAAPFVFDSRRIHRSVEFAEYAKLSFEPERPIYDAAMDLTKRIHRDFKYDSHATVVHTLPKEAFDLRRGVCQDFAQVQIACLRSLGIPARYVSGYLRTNPPMGASRLIGADQSHAWLSIYCGAGLGWIDLDPTNSCLCQTDHIPIAWGRDYHDVVPMRGVFLGGGAHTLEVSVDVAPLD